jgi:hypothetical protein
MNSFLKFSRIWPFLLPPDTVEVGLHWIPPLSMEVALLVNGCAGEFDRRDTSRAPGGRLGRIPPLPQAVSPVSHNRPGPVLPAPAPLTPTRLQRRGRTEAAAPGAVLSSPPLKSIQILWISNWMLSKGNSHSPLSIIPKSLADLWIFLKP